MARPSWCTVPGCCFYRKSMATGNAFHRYPVKDPERCKRWLIAVRHIKYDVKTPVATLNSLRVCSKHFREDDYERDFQAEMMGTKNKRSLKDTAVPSVFPWTGPAVPKYRGAFEKRKRAEVLASIEGLNRTSKVNQPVTTTSSSAIYAVGGTVSQPRLDREQLLDDTGSLTVEITEELFGSDHDDDVATAPDGEEEFLSSEEEPEEPKKKKKKRKNKKDSSDEWEPSDKEDTVILMHYSSDSSEDLETVGSSDLTEGAKAATSQTDREEGGKLVVWWCDECGAEPEVTCTTRRHKMQYACAVCVGEGEQAVGFDQFYMRFDDLSSLKNHVQLEHNTKVCQRTLCPDCGRYHFKKDHLCEHKIKKIPCLDCDSQEQGEREKERNSQELNSGTEEKKQGGRSSPKEQGEGQEPIHQSEQEREKREPRKRRHKSSQRQTSDPEEFEEEGVRQINSDSDFNPAEERTTTPEPSSRFLRPLSLTPGTRQPARPEECDSVCVSSGVPYPPLSRPLLCVCVTDSHRDVGWRGTAGRCPLDRRDITDMAA
ncbi:hypothetical protein J4Q44_G00189420 [Coregonus suidteri]|uniref:THAP domain-containing protein 1 n=1 Tax=Coregonus suidteri TaxID=861788 RepID=A0AAN8LM07_9TELE